MKNYVRSGDRFSEDA